MHLRLGSVAVAGGTRIERASAGAQALKAIKITVPAGGPGAIAITPNGKTAYVVNHDGPGLVTPINTATNKALKPFYGRRHYEGHRDHP